MMQPFRRQLLIATAALGLVGTAAAQTKWDLPAAYPANNFHTENLQQFANDVDKATNGKLKVQLHPNASLFKAPEIKRAVQGGQAQAGEILLVNYENEDPLYGLDGVPFLATSYKDAYKLYKAERKALFSGHVATIVERDGELATPTETSVARISKSRLPSAPELPTVDEAGLMGVGEGFAVSCGLGDALADGDGCPPEENVGRGVGVGDSVPCGC